MRFWVLFFLCLIGVPTHARAADALRVKGNQLYYGKKIVQLQGVAVGDPLMTPMPDYNTISHDWNSNVVRISIHPGSWRRQERKHVISLLHANVQAALDSGMFVIITWHAIGMPDGYMQPSQEPADTKLYDTDFALAQDFWGVMTNEFGNDGRIMFELWNEPQEKGGARDKHWAELKPYWEKLTTLIRKHSNNVLIATSSGWAYNLQGVAQSLLPDKNTMYAWHVYAGTDDNDPALWEKNLGHLSDKKPVIVSEWGFEPGEKDSGYYGNAQDYGYLFYDRFLKAKNLHFTAWCWHSTWMPRMLQQDMKTPTEYGNFIKEILWRKPKEQLIRP